MRRDLIEMVDEYKLLTPEKRKEWRRWATPNTEFDGEQDEKEFYNVLDRIDAENLSGA